MKSILDLVCLNTQVGSVIGKGGVCEWEGGGGGRDCGIVEQQKQRMCINVT